jgi:hypothetical protein
MAAIDTNLVGVGYGTEGIINFSSAWIMGQFANLEDDNLHFISLAAHNSVVTMAFRLGIVGFILCVCWLLYMLLLTAGQRHKWGVAQAAQITYFCAFLVLFVNPGLESVVYMFGIAIGMSFSLAVSKIHAPIGFWKSESHARQLLLRGAYDEMASSCLDARGSEVGQPPGRLVQTSWPSTSGNHVAAALAGPRGHCP